MGWNVLLYFFLMALLLNCVHGDENSWIRRQREDSRTVVCSSGISLPAYMDLYY
jgi:hypothetical protein